MSRLPDPNRSISARYTGELRTYLFGDREAAARYLGVARNLIGALRNRLALGGISSGRDEITLANGVEIRVLVAGGMHEALIGAPPGAEGEEDEEEFPYLSGLHEIARVFADPQGTSPPRYATQFYPAFKVGKLDRKWYRLNIGFSDNQPWPLTPDLLPDRSQNSPLTAFARNWLDRTLPLLDIQLWELKDYPAWPTLYTGTMRKVIQKILGRKLRNPFSTNCGIYIPDPKKAAIDQRRWVIEIVPDGIASGVFAYPIRFFNEMELLDRKRQKTVREQGDTDRYDYGLETSFIPPAQESNSVEEVLASRGLLKLRIAPSLESVYKNNWTTMTPWYTGWAFSYSGHEAQIVIFESRDFGGYPAKYATRYKLSIAADGQSRPISAKLETVDEGWAKLGHLTFQLYAPITKPLQEQVFWDSAATLPDFDTPLYVFYDRDDKEVVLRLRYKASVAVADVHINTLDCTTTHVTMPQGLCLVDREFVTMELCNNGEIVNITGKTSGTVCCYCERTFPTAYTENYTIGSEYRWIGGPQGETGWTVQCNLIIYTFVYVKGLYIQIFKSTDQTHIESRSFTNRVTLPLYEREGFFHYRIENRTAVDGYTHQDFVSTPPNSAIYWFMQRSEGGTLNAVAPAWTTGGDYDTPVSTYYPPGTVFSTPGYKYIGSVTNRNNDTDNAVIVLKTDANTYDSFFGEYFQAVAVNEAFSGKCVLLPEPKTSWLFSAEYPIHKSYRYEAKQFPINLCFVGDGTGDDTWRQSGKPDAFSELEPKLPAKLSDPSSPIDLYAGVLPNG